MTAKEAETLGYMVVEASPFEVGLIHGNDGVRTWFANEFHDHPETGRRLPPLDHPLIQQAIEIHEAYRRHLALEAWLATRPPAVKQLARKYPPGTRFVIHGEIQYVVAYNEDGSLSVSSINPSADYKGAVATRKALCACCLDRLDERLL